MNNADMVRLAQELIKIPSPTYGERELALFLTSVMEPIFDTVRVDDLNNVIALLEGTGPGPTIMFNGHIDHVDPGTMEDPFSGQIVDAGSFEEVGEAVYGRGSCDMKGAIAAMVAAASDLRSTGFAGRLVMTAVALEEPGEGAGSIHAVKSLDRMPDVAIIGESTAGDICLGHRGKVELELELKGRTAHASNPAWGINAILLTNRFLSSWPELPMPEDPIVGKCTSAVTNITCSPGRLAVVPDRCTLTFDNRFLPGESPERPQRDVERLLEQIRAERPEFEYELRRTRTLLAYRLSPDEPSVGLLSRVVENITGRAPRHRGWLFGTDAVYLNEAYGIPCVGYGPGNEIWAHTPSEHVPVADLVVAKQVYAEFVRRLGSN